MDLHISAPVMAKLTATCEQAGIPLETALKCIEMVRASIAAERKERHAEYQHRWYIKNKARAREQHSRWLAAHKAERAEYARQYYQARKAAKETDHDPA